MPIIELFKPSMIFRSLLLMLCLATLASCTGGSGASTESNSVGSDIETAVGVSYNGIAPASQAVRDFKTYFWDEMVEEEVDCARCHMQGGQGSMKFVRNDNINTAYNEALTVVDLADPANSRLVQYVFNGHNCWSPDPSQCRDTLTTFITNWAAGVVTATATQINLTAPTDHEPTGAVTFPDDATQFDDLHTLLTTNCSGCHSDTAPILMRQTPLFASADRDLAYEAAKTKIDVVNPENSRLVVRLRDESHNCWSLCTDDANDLLVAINTLLPDVAEDVDTATLVTSLAMRLNSDGIQVTRDGRVENYIIAEYEFRLGSGSTVVDRSSVLPAMPLTLIGDYEWQSAWGVRFNNGRAQASVNDSRKLYNELTGTGEYSIEAWVFPDNITQDDSARIVSYSGGSVSRNFTVGQSLYNYDVLNRSSVTDGDGRPMLSTPDADEVAQTALQHLVVTYHPDSGRRVYVDGVLVSDADPEGGGTLYNWDQDFAFVLGNEVSGNRPWQGMIRYAAIHNRALSLADIGANYTAGVGQRFFMLFRLAEFDAGSSIVEQTANDNSYIVFEVSQYDNYSYLFAAPFYFSLGDTSSLAPVAVEGMRIGINGKIASVGQAFATLDVDVIAAGYDNETGFPLSSQGMIVTLENGPDLDQFFLSFDTLGANSNVFTEPTFADPDFSIDTPINFSSVAIRNFSEIRESFAQITGINSNNAAVGATYNLVIQQLPTSEDIGGFLSAHQMGITQLAISYCNVLIDTKSARDALGISLDEVDDPNIDDANAKSVADWDTDFIDPMIEVALNTGLTVQPSAADVKAQLHHLLFVDADGIAEIDPTFDPDPDGLARCSGGCPDGETALAAKAACAAVLGSAAVTLQ